MQSLQVPLWISLKFYPLKYSKIPSLSESIRNFLNHTGICIRTKQFLSDLIRSYFSNQINPRSVQKINPKLVFRMNPNKSELIRIFNPNESGLSEWIRMIPKNSVSFWLSGFIRINLDWNLFRTNRKISESCRNFYPHQTVSFPYNPKKFFNPNQSEVHSKSIRILYSECIRTNPN